MLYQTSAHDHVICYGSVANSSAPLAKQSLDEFVILDGPVSVRVECLQTRHEGL